MSDIFDYYDYKTFLQSELQTRQSSNPSYSLRLFAYELELSPSALSHLFKNRFHLSPKRSRFLAEKLNLNPDQTAYFELLVSYHQDISEEEKQKILARLAAINPKKNVRSMELEQFSLINNWYAMTLLEVLKLRPVYFFDLTSIADEFKVAVEDLEFAAKKLIEFEFIRVNAQGKLDRCIERINLYAENPNPMVKNFHHQMIEKMHESIDLQTPDERISQFDIMAFSENEFNEAQKIIRECSDRIVELSFKSTNRTHIYSLGIGFFKLYSAKNSEVKQ